MIKTGDLVIEKINNIDSKVKEKIFIVLFNYWNNDKEYVCVCPITNTKKPKYNDKCFLKNYVYIPYEILNDKRMCSVKINNALMYKVDELSETGLSLRNEIMLRIFDGIINLNLERPSLSLNKEHFEYIKNALVVLKSEMLEQVKNKNKETKKLRKARKKELKRNYNNIRK